MSDAPTEPGGFVGDIYYGDPDRTTFGTHRWNGSEWMELGSEAEALTMLLGNARARIADLTRQLAEAREVKPLEWDDWGASHRIVLAATSPAGVYRITQRYFPEESFILEKPNNDASSHPSCEAAKAAAQADYTARILSALKGTP